VTVVLTPHLCHTNDTFGWFCPSDSLCDNNMHSKSLVGVDDETWHRVVHILEHTRSDDLWRAHSLCQTLGANKRPTLLIGSSLSQ
jgi:hypothetical protein